MAFEYEYKEQYRHSKNWCLNMTDSCNLACKYCFVHQQPHFMTLQTAKDAVDFVYENLKYFDKTYPEDAPHKSIFTYFGGEPTLCWDTIILPLTDYIEKKYPNRFRLTITTNGTLLNKERIDYLVKHDILPLLSIDGDKETQDANRPCREEGKSSFDMVSKNIPYLLEKFPQTTFRATIDQATVHKVFDSYLFAVQNNFKNIFITPNCREPWSQENLATLKGELEKIYTFFSMCMIDGIQPIGFKALQNSFEDVLKRDLEVVNHRQNAIDVCRWPIRCGLGTGSGSIGWDGKIYGCQEQDSYAGTESIFYMGDIYNGVDVERHSQLLKEYSKQAISYCEKKEMCEGCNLRTLCQDIGCPSVDWDMFHDFQIFPEVQCFWEQTCFNCAVSVMKMLVDMDNQFFKKYLYYGCNYQHYWKEEEYFAVPIM